MRQRWSTVTLFMVWSSSARGSAPHNTGCTTHTRSRDDHDANVIKVAAPPRNANDGERGRLMMTPTPSSQRQRPALDNQRKLYDPYSNGHHFRSVPAPEQAPM